MPVLKMVHCSYNLKTFFFQKLHIRVLLYHLNTVFYIETCCNILIFLFLNSFPYIVSYILDMSVGVMLYCRLNCTAMVMSKYNHQLTVKMVCCIFNTSKLMRIHYISCHADNKKFPYSR